MEFKELKKKKTADLHKLLAESRDTLRDLRFKVASKQLKDVSVVKKIKKTIANVLTLLNADKNENPSEATEKTEEKNKAI